ncbi:hypothetical protein PUS82_05380 [Cytobacillus firmus]|uniref:hypothetical protein n=1 Tax=Cytobacillus firmus TaxID=1399 RepID=UPI00237BC7D8|nr:hypothetical protein [Cytobacillus firmus]MDD9310735.1 hypothetical protein [Cytobacillus firmus]
MYPPGDFYVEAIIEVKAGEETYVMYIQRPFESIEWRFRGIFKVSIESPRIHIKDENQWFEIFINDKKEMINVVADAVESQFMKLMEDELM